MNPVPPKPSLDGTVNAPIEGQAPGGTGGTGALTRA